MRPARQPLEVWRVTRRRIWERDRGRCRHCAEAVRLRACHIDHILPLWRGGTNEDANLRVLCRRCHILRLDPGHRGLVAEGLRRGIIPPNWRDLVWDDEPEARPAGSGRQQERPGAGEAGRAGEMLQNAPCEGRRVSSR